MNDVERGFLCIFSSQCAAGDTHALCFFFGAEERKKYLEFGDGKLLICACKNYIRTSKLCESNRTTQHVLFTL